MKNTTSYLTLERNTIKYLLNFVEEYELVKQKKHPRFKFIRDFFKENQICFQNFYKFYRRFVSTGRDPQALLPTRRGPKPKYKELPLAPNSLEAQILEYRSKGYTALP